MNNMESGTYQVDVQYGCFDKHNYVSFHNRIVSVEVKKPLKKDEFVSKVDALSRNSPYKPNNCNLVTLTVRNIMNVSDLNLL